jgi:hypothetical protein
MAKNRNPNAGENGFWQHRWRRANKSILHLRRQIRQIGEAGRFTVPTAIGSGKGEFLLIVGFAFWLRVG